MPTEPEPPCRTVDNPALSQRHGVRGNRVCCLLRIGQRNGKAHHCAIRIAAVSRTVSIQYVRRRAKQPEGDDSGTPDGRMICATFLDER